MAHLSDGPGTVKGIGPKKQRLLEGMGIHTLRDVLQLYPFRYDDWSQLCANGAAGTTPCSLAG